jgi:regulation of enolase protein 1 (concanavalin A-like superfamily)
LAFYHFYSANTATAALPGPWLDSDIGTTGAAGSASVTNGTYTINGSGADIWGNADGFHFAYQQLNGTDLELIAKVNSIGNTNEWAKAGLMIRENLLVGSKHASAFITSLNGTGLQYRSTTNDISYHTGSTGTAPIWLKLVRAGNLFTTYKSTDGITWVTIGSTTVTMPANVYVGLAVTSHQSGTINSSTFSNVSMSVKTGLPQPWVNGDVGTTGAIGTAAYSNGIFTLQGSGSDIWDAADGFHYVYQEVTTDVEIIGRVDNLGNTNGWAKAGVMIREGLAANSKHAMAVVTPSNGSALQYRSATGGISYHVGSTGTAPIWLKLNKTGSQFTASKSTDGTNWVVISTTTISMVEKVYVGLIVTSHNSGVLTSTNISNVVVNKGNVNKLPTATITSPVSNASFTAPANISITANATDADGSVSRVEFYNGATKLGEDLTAPYSFAWNNVPVGTYTVTARAFDNTGASANSAPISIIVKQITQSVSVNYTESSEDFPNPERGFYRYTETRASNYTVLTASELRSYRNLQQPWNANYSVMSTLMFRYYILDTHKSTPLSSSFLTNFSRDCQAAREAGVKLIPRFTYTVSTNSTGCSDNTACPLYGDASKATVLNHITQLKPLLQQNADVIAAVQMGFIGIWGEQYYTDHFGDASSNGQGKLLDQNWRDRSEVVQALLDALPTDRYVQVRYPQMKQRFIYGVNAPVTSAALTSTEAFTGTSKARVGFHNDCYLSSYNDVGTYVDYGNSSSSPRDATNELRTYFSNDSRYVPVGGETCSDSYSPQNDCEPTGKAITEFQMMHYSYLNADYSNDVNNDWQTGGCMDQIKKNLGYRLLLKKGTYPTQVSVNGGFNLSLDIENKGYASPFNERSAYLILKNRVSGQVHSIKLATDIRRWFTGNISIQENLSLPTSVTAGEYDLFLHLPDKYQSIAARSEYAIRLANTGLWDATTGYNNLNHKIVVGTGTGAIFIMDEASDLTAQQIQISPNPTSGSFKVQLPNGNKAASYSLVNSMGFEISTGSLSNKEEFELDLSGTKAGMYILKIKSNGSDYIERVFIQ